MLIDSYNKGIQKLKQAEFISDINSENDDPEELKKSRKNRAKKMMSDTDNDDIDDNQVVLPSCPKIPQMHKPNASSSKKVDSKQKQQCTSKIRNYKYFLYCVHI